MTAKMITEMIRQKFFRLFVLLLISMPLMVCYPIMLYGGFSTRVSTIATVLLSVVVYVLVASKKPSLWRNLPELTQLENRVERKKAITSAPDRVAITNAWAAAAMKLMTQDFCFLFQVFFKSKTLLKETGHWNRKRFVGHVIRASVYTLLFIELATLLTEIFSQLRGFQFNYASVAISIAWGFGFSASLGIAWTVSWGASSRVAWSVPLIFACTWGAIWGLSRGVQWGITLGIAWCAVWGLIWLIVRSGAALNEAGGIITGVAAGVGFGLATAVAEWFAWTFGFVTDAGFGVAEGAASIWGITTGIGLAIAWGVATSVSSKAEGDMVGWSIALAGIGTVSWFFWGIGSGFFLGTVGDVVENGMKRGFAGGSSFLFFYLMTWSRWFYLPVFLFAFLRPIHPQKLPSHWDENIVVRLPFLTGTLCRISRYNDNFRQAAIDEAVFLFREIPSQREGAQRALKIIPGGKDVLAKIPGNEQMPKVKVEKELSNPESEVKDGQGQRSRLPLKAFISYKWEDNAHNKWVETLATDLRYVGIKTFLDRWEVRFGDSFTDYMTSKINEADVVLFIITTASVAAVEAPKGQGGAVKFEMQMATARRTAGEKMRLIGIYRAGDKTSAHLRDHRFADFRDDTGYAERLRELVDDLLGRTSPPPVSS